MEKLQNSSQTLKTFQTTKSKIYIHFNPKLLKTNQNRKIEISLSMSFHDYCKGQIYHQRVKAMPERKIIVVKYHRYYRVTH